MEGQRILSRTLDGFKVYLSQANNNFGSTTMPATQCSCDIIIRIFLTNCPGYFMIRFLGKKCSVVDPKLLFSDPDLGLISDPDLACLTKVIRLYLICPQESIAQRFSSHFRR
jgi:hypothetical protein